MTTYNHPFASKKIYIFVLCSLADAILHFKPYLGASLSRSVWKSSLLKLEKYKEVYEDIMRPNWFAVSQRLLEHSRISQKRMLIQYKMYTSIQRQCSTNRHNCKNFTHTQTSFQAKSHDPCCLAYSLAYCITWITYR